MIRDTIELLYDVEELGKNNVIVFDTETTGLPIDWGASARKVDNWPRIIEFGWALYKRNGELIDHASTLIKPDGWVVPDEKFWRDNGFSTEGCEKDGVPIGEVLDDFIFSLSLCDVMVAHNLQYDLNVVAAEMFRAGVAALNKPKRICTKQLTTNICKIQRGGWAPGVYKWPTLSELHMYLFGEDFTGAHAAASDVLATGRCFFELVKRKHIVI